MEAAYNAITESGRFSCMLWQQLCEGAEFEEDKAIYWAHIAAHYRKLAELKKMAEDEYLKMENSSVERWDHFQHTCEDDICENPILFWQDVIRMCRMSRIKKELHRKFRV